MASNRTPTIIAFSTAVLGLLALAAPLSGEVTEEITPPTHVCANALELEEYLFESKPLGVARTEIEQSFPRNECLGTVRMMGDSGHSRIEYHFPLPDDDKTLVLTFASRKRDGLSVLAGFWTKNSDG